MFDTPFASAKALEFEPDLVTATKARLGGSKRRIFDYALKLAVLDMASLSIAFWGAYFARFSLGAGGGPVQHYLPAYILALLAFLAAAMAERAYSEPVIRHQLRTVDRALRAALIMVGALMLIAFTLKITDTYSRVWAATGVASFIGLLICTRIIQARYIQAQMALGCLSQRVLIVGSGLASRRVADDLLCNAVGQINVVGFVDDQRVQTHASSGAGATLAGAYKGVPLLGNTQALPALIENLAIDRVVLALPWTARGRIQKIQRQIEQYNIDVLLAPEQADDLCGDRPWERLGNAYYPALSHRPLSDSAAAIKRLEDIVVASLALLILWPLMAATALAIKLDTPGPVLFRQKRYGFNKNLIDVYKFRSMHWADTDMNAVKQTTRADPRTTRVGRFIRKTSIDELPQLFNVLGGSMSIVGPRPHATETKVAGRRFEDVVDDYASRHRMRPGITGWAQVNGWRGETDTEAKIEARVEHDLFYIRNWSLVLDLYIIIKTAFVVLFERENAY